MKMYYLDGTNKQQQKKNKHILKYLKRFTANYNASSGEKTKKKQWLNQLEIQLERFR